MAPAAARPAAGASLRVVVAPASAASAASLIELEVFDTAEAARDCLRKSDNARAA